MSKYKTAEPRTTLAEETTTPQSKPLPGVPRKSKRKAVASPKKVKKVTGHKRRINKFEIEERRTKIQRLRLRGLGYENIAKLLGITAVMVERDMIAIADKNRKSIDNFQQNQFIAENLGVLDEVMERAWAEFSTAAEGTTHRLKSLDLVRSTQGDKMKALIDCGLIEKEPQHIDVEHSFKLDWDPDFQDRVVAAMLLQATPSQLAEPTPDTTDIIDVESDDELEPIPVPFDTED